MDPRTSSTRRAVVTASDSGIGKATAVALAEQGHDVGITWHTDEQGALDTAEEVRGHGRQAYVERLDTADVPGCGDVVDLQPVGIEPVPAEQVVDLVLDPASDAGQRHVDGDLLPEALRPKLA